MEDDEHRRHTAQQWTPSDVHTSYPNIEVDKTNLLNAGEDAIVPRFDRVV